MGELRETIARAIYENEVAHVVKRSVIPELNILTWDQMADHPDREIYTTNANAVIAALGLTEELGSRSHGTGLMDCGVTPGPDILGRHNHRRWVTDWKGVPRE